MKRYLIGAAFALAATGSAGLSALSVNGMRGEGSNTLFDFTVIMFNSCPQGPNQPAALGTVAAYAGTGSTNGQSEMVARDQQIAPMSRFLDNGVGLCATVLVEAGADGSTVGSTVTQPDGAVTPDLTHAAGLVVALDSIDIFGSPTTFGSAACNGDDNAACDPTFEVNTGLAYNTTIALSGGGTYTFTGWRDVLRVLLAGWLNTNTGTDATAWSQRDCSGPVRTALANSYGLLFENNCTATAGDSTGNCTQIRHIFRSDDFSGATNTLTSLLNLPTVITPEAIGFLVSGGPVVTSDHTGASPFCNAVRPAFVFPSASAPTCLQGTDASWDPTSKNKIATCAGQLAVGAGAVTSRENAVYRATMQDNDPIRRTCVGAGTVNPSEDVCSHSGDLGLVLPLNDTLLLPGHTNADRYNAAQCMKGFFVSVSAPDVYDAVTQLKQVCSRGLLCPNGDACNNFGGCIAPSMALLSPQCLAFKLSTPALTISSTAVPAVNPKLPSQNDGRSYNQHLYVQVGSAGAYQTNGFTIPIAMTGAYHRIHTNHTLSTNTSIPTCQQADMTSQVGCLVAASPCSIGYAGRTALTQNPNTVALKLDKINPDLLCVQGNFIYPLSRKMYLNSILGLDRVGNGVPGDQEAQLVGCETDLAQPSLGIPAGLVSSAAVSAGLLPLPSFVNGGEPYCEDFNESLICGFGNANVDACQKAPPYLDAFPTFDTVCGNGQLDAYEDCDNGVFNGTPGNSCSSTCRFVN
jgi:hypothetical protein